MARDRDEQAGARHGRDEDQRAGRFPRERGHGDEYAAAGSSGRDTEWRPGGEAYRRRAGTGREDYLQPRASRRARMGANERGGAPGGTPGEQHGDGRHERFGGYGGARGVGGELDRGAGVHGERSFRGRGPRNFRRSDARLLEDVNERLTADPQLDATDITVEVSEGKVTLQGRVDERWMKHHAEDLVDRCAGVSDIDNRIRVGPRTTSA